MKYLFAAIIVVCSVRADAQLVLIDQSEAQTAQRTPEVPQKPVRAIRRPELIIYSESWCGACQVAKRQIQENHPWIDLDVRSGSDIPGWVSVLPTFHWQDGSGQWRQSAGWSSQTQKTVIAGMASLREETAESTVDIPAEAQPTPNQELHRLLAIIKPRTDEVFIDPGCGDGRACIIASSVYGCQSVGIEIDEDRAELAKQRVRQAGLEDLVTIIQGDSREIKWSADCGFVYLYPDLLQELSPKLRQLDRFASYRHPVEGLRMRESNDSFLYDSTSRSVRQQEFAVWQGQRYTGRVCTSPGCRMCNSIQSQLED